MRYEEDISPLDDDYGLYEYEQDKYNNPLSDDYIREDYIENEL